LRKQLVLRVLLLRGRCGGLGRRKRVQVLLLLLQQLLLR